MHTVHRLFSISYSREPVDDSAHYLSGPELWTGAERAEREELAKELYDMAEAEPPVPPTLDYYTRLFRCLMKYDDWYVSHQPRWCRTPFCCYCLPFVLCLIFNAAGWGPLFRFVSCYLVPLVAV